MSSVLPVAVVCSTCADCREGDVICARNASDRRHGAALSILKVRQNRGFLGPLPTIVSQEPDVSTMPLVLPSESLSVSRDGLFAGYDLDAAYDEMFEEGGQARSHCRALFDDLRGATPADL